MLGSGTRKTGRLAAAGDAAKHVVGERGSAAPKLAIMRWRGRRRSIPRCGSTWIFGARRAESGSRSWTMSPAPEAGGSPRDTVLAVRRAVVLRFRGR